MPQDLYHPGERLLLSGEALNVAVLIVRVGDPDLMGDGVDGYAVTAFRERRTAKQGGGAFGHLVCSQESRAWDVEPLEARIVTNLIALLLEVQGRDDLAIRSIEDGEHAIAACNEESSHRLVQNQSMRAGDASELPLANDGLAIRIDDLEC